MYLSHFAFVGLAEGLINAEPIEPKTTVTISAGIMQYAAAVTLPSLPVAAAVAPVQVSAVRKPKPTTHHGPRVQSTIYSWMHSICHHTSKHAPSALTGWGPKGVL